MRLQSCEKAMGWCSAQCKMLLFWAKTIFELAHLKKKGKNKIWPSGNFLIQFFRDVFAPLGMFVIKTLEVEWHVVTKAYKFTVFERFFCIIVYCVSTLLLHIESTDSMIWVKTGPGCL